MTHQLLELVAPQQEWEGGVHVYFFPVMVLGFRIRGYHSLFIGNQYLEKNSLLYPSIMGLCNGGANKRRFEVSDDLQAYVSDPSCPKGE